MSDSITLALQGLRDVLLTMDASPNPNPNGGYIYPDDYPIISTLEPPFFVVSEIKNTWQNWQPWAQGTGVHTWLAECMLCLKRGPLENEDSGYVAEMSEKHYLLAMVKSLYSDQSLNQSVFNIGTNTDLLRNRIGNLARFKQVYWGIYLEIPIVQYHGLACTPP